MLMGRTDCADVIIAGAGPAGATAARLLAAAGLKVLLLERRPWPREKPCGGGITGRALAALADSGLPRAELLPVLETAVTSLQVVCGRGPPVTWHYHEPLVHVTDRSRFDAALVEAAVRAGAVFRPGVAVTAVEQTGQQVLVHAGGRTLAARFGLGADGAASHVAGSIRFPPPDAVCRYLATVLPLCSGWQGRALVDLGAVALGYAWSFPRRHDLAVGIGSRRAGRSDLDRLLRQFIRRYGLPPPERVVCWFTPFRTRWTPLHRGRVAVLGDAAGLADPLTGEGVSRAILSGMLAAKAVLAALAGNASDLGEYSRLLRARLWPAQAVLGVGASLSPLLFPAFRLTGGFWPVKAWFLRAFTRRNSGSRLA